MATVTDTATDAVFSCDAVKCTQKELFYGNWCWMSTAPRDESCDDLDHYTFCERCWGKGRLTRADKSDSTSSSTETRMMMTVGDRGAGNHRAQRVQVKTGHFRDYF